VRVIRLINRIGMWVLIALPVLWSGRDNLREQFGYGQGQPWDTWGAIASGWGFWLVGIVIWIAIVRGVCGWIDRKLARG
jgi:hypothetical protein